MAQFDIKKIKRDGYALMFDYRKKKDSYVSTHTSKFCEMAQKELYEAFDALADGFCNGLDFALIVRENIVRENSVRENIVDRFRPVGVNYGEDNAGREFAVIACEYMVSKTSEKVAIKSPPYFLAATKKEALLFGYWDVDTSRLLMKLREEAQYFLAGRRAQGSLFDAPTTAPETEDAEGMSDELLDEAIPFAKDAALIGGNVFPMRG